MGVIKDRIRQLARHPSHVDYLYRARCECGWVGPVREFEMDADDDRGAHWRHQDAGPARRERA